MKQNLENIYSDSREKSHQVGNTPEIGLSSSQTERQRLSQGLWGLPDRSLGGCGGTPTSLHGALGKGVRGQETPLKSPKEQLKRQKVSQLFGLLFPVSNDIPA